MRALEVVVLQPRIQIMLQCIDAVVEAFAECHLVKLLQDGFVEPLADAVRLRRFHLGLGVVNVVDRQEKQKIMLVGPSTIF